MKAPFIRPYLLLAFTYLIIATSCSSQDKNDPAVTDGEVTDGTTDPTDPTDPSTPSAAAKVYITTMDETQLLKQQDVPANSTAAPDATLQVDPEKTYQTMDGFGYTLTGGSALHLSKMSPSARTAILQELFGTGPDDIGVSYIRLSVGASDLDERPWSYNDLPAGETDTDLSEFSMAYDTLYLIPVLKEILQISPDLKLMGSPWSPPAWMKDNKDTKGGSLLPEYHAVYAEYLAKYVQGMQEEGITIDALTIQNEPLHPGNNPSLLMLADQQSEFIKSHLGPLFEELGIQTKIVIYDHNADRPDYPISILNDQETAQYVDGSAFHLYGGTIDALSQVHDAHPSKSLYFTEQWIGAPGYFDGDVPWHTENVIIGASKNWSKAVLQWNLAADENEDPHTDRGGCDQCLGALTITGNVITRNPGYYIVAQASKFVPPGSVRIDSSTLTDLPNVAFKTPDGELVVILQNKSDSSKTLDVQLGDTSVVVELPGKSNGTLVY